MLLTAAPQIRTASLEVSALVQCAEQGLILKLGVRTSCCCKHKVWTDPTIASSALLVSYRSSWDFPPHQYTHPRPTLSLDKNLEKMRMRQCISTSTRLLVASVRAGRVCTSGDQKWCTYMFAVVSYRIKMELSATNTMKIKIYEALMTAGVVLSVCREVSLLSFFAWI